MASPSPAPPPSRVRALSGRAKGSKILSSHSSGTPGPRSKTARRISPSPRRAVRRIDRRLGEVQQFVDELGEFLDLLIEGGEFLLLRGGQFLFEDAEGHAHSDERRTQLVGDVSEEALLAGDVFVQALGHSLDSPAQAPQFVGPGGGHFHLEFSLRD